MSRTPKIPSSDGRSDKPTADSIDTDDPLDSGDRSTGEWPESNLGPEPFDMDRVDGNNTVGLGLTFITRWLIIIATLGMILPAVLIFFASKDDSESRIVTGNLVKANVTDVIDGITISVLIEGVPEVVRYIGVQLPEPGHLFYDLSFNQNRRWVFGQEILVETDQKRRNSKGQLLSYVWIKDGMINAALLASGLASHANAPPNSRYSDIFDKLEDDARGKGLGIWHPDNSGA